MASGKSNPTSYDCKIDNTFGNTISTKIECPTSWVESETLAGYHSYGNGAAMRCAFAGWYAKTLAEAQLLGALTAHWRIRAPTSRRARATSITYYKSLKGGPP